VRDHVRPRAAIPEDWKLPGRIYACPWNLSIRATAFSRRRDAGKPPMIDKQIGWLNLDFNPTFDRFFTAPA